MYRTNRKLRAAITANLAVAVAIALCCQSSQAGSMTLDPNDGNQNVTLEYLTEDTSNAVIVGDKMFYNFRYSASSDMPDASEVQVSGITDNNDNFGIRFQGAFTDLLDAGTQRPSDASITFDVGVTPEAFRAGWRISDAHLFGSGVGNFDLAGEGSFISVDENFVGNDPVINGGISAFASNFGQGGQQLEDWIFFDDLYEKLSVQKDILAFSSGLGQLPARMTIIDQTFSQTQIPEPTTLGMTCLAAAFAVIRRKRNN